MITASKIVNEFKIEYGEEGYKMVADHLKGFVKLWDHISNLKKQMAATRALGALGGEEMKPQAQAAMREQAKYLKIMNQELKLRNEALAKEVKFLEQKHKLEAATPYGRFMNQWEKLGQVFRRVADALVSFLVINTIRNALQGFFGGLIQANSLLQNLETRLQGVNKGKDGSFKELINDIVMLTVKTPFMIKDFTDAAITLQAFGLSAKKNLGPIADWAAAIGKDLGDVSTAFAKVSMGSPRTALLLSTRGISKKEFDEELRVTHDRTQALVNIIERQFGGLAFKVSRTFEGMVANLKDAWFLLSQQMGLPIFKEMNKDVEKLYFTVLSMAKGAKEGSVGVKIFGEGLASIYSLIKLVIPSIIMLAGATGFMRLRTSAIGAYDALLKHGRAISGIGIATAALLPAIALMVDRMTELNAIEVKFAEAQELINKLTLAGAGFTRGYVDALEAQIEAIKQLATLRDLSAGEWEPKKWAAQGIGLAARGFDIKYFAELAIEEKFRDALLASLEAERRTRLAIIDLKERERELSKEVHGTEIQGLNEEMAKRMKGKEYLTKLRDALAEIVNAESKLFPGVTEKNRAMVAGMWENENGTNRFQQFLNMQKAVDVLNRTISFDVNAEAVKAVGEAFDSIDEVLKTIASKGLNSELAMDLIKTLPEIPTAKAMKEYEDLTAKIAEARARLSELQQGENPLYAKIAGNKAEEKVLQEKIAIMQAKGIHSLKETWQYNVLLLKLLTAQIAIIQDKKSLDEKVADAELKIVENRRGYTKALEDLISGNLKRQYDMTGNIAYYYQDLNDSVEILQHRLAEVTDEMYNQYALGEKDKQDPVAYKQHLAAAIGFDKERLQLLEAIADLQFKIWSGPSATFLLGLEKGIIRIRQELNKVWDDMAEMSLDSLREFGSFALSTLLYGDTTDQTAEKISEYNMELQQLYAEASRAASSMSQVKRREGETNDAYLARVQMLEEIQQTQAETYILKTKEMEIMEKINAAERERSNIILERLQQIASKMSDKIMDTLMNLLISTVGGALTGGSSPVSKPGGWNDTGGGGSPVSPGSGGSSSIVITGNQIFGQEDFNAMVDTAIKKNSDRRSR